MWKYEYIICCECQCLHGLLLKVFVILLIKSSSEAVAPCHARCDLTLPTAGCLQSEVSWSCSCSVLLAELELFVLPASGSFLPKSVKLAELHVIWWQGMWMAQMLTQTRLFVHCVCTNKQHVWLEVEQFLIVWCTVPEGWWKLPSGQHVGGWDVQL